MKKKQIANAVMALLIVGIAVCGIWLAWSLQEGGEAGYGTAFSVKPIPDNRLVQNEESANLCTVTVLCNTVFNDPARLEKEKIPYVPQDGIMLPTVTVEFEPGETAFDVLRRVCEAAELPLEYSWTPLYDSYYVEGIGHLYEFDCGFESGWMYQVNGVFPNYGASSYRLQGGETIVWCYTCSGLGTDVGAEKGVVQ